MISTFKLYSFLPDAKKVGEEISKIYESGKGINGYNNIPEFVDKIGVSVNSFHKWKRGECFPDIESLKKIVNLSAKKISLDDILIPDANLDFEYEKYPQFLNQNVTFNHNFNEISNESFENIENYKKHCELVNYLVQKEIFAFRDESKYCLKYNIDKYIADIAIKYGFDYRMNKDKHKEILCYYRAESLKNFFSDYFKDYINKLIQSNQNEKPSRVLDNSVTDLIFSYLRLCESENLDYQIKIFEMLDDCYKFCAYMALVYLDNPKTRNLVVYLNEKNDSYNELNDFIKELSNDSEFKEKIEEEFNLKNEKEGVLRQLKHMHESQKYAYTNEKELIEEYHYYALICLFINLLNIEELAAFDEMNYNTLKSNGEDKKLKDNSDKLHNALLEVIYG